MHCFSRQLTLAPLHDEMWSMKQLTAWSTKNCAFGQPSATQLAMQLTLTLGGMLEGSMHLTEHSSAAMQLVGSHWVQSCGQLVHVS